MRVGARVMVKVKVKNAVNNGERLETIPGSISA
jgi:hypothetical protein